MSPSSSQDLIDRLRDHSARLGVIGLGYVGLPLAVMFAKAGFATTGFAGQVNSGMPRFMVDRVVEALSFDRKPLRDARVHLFGIAYTPGVGDVRESPAIDIARLLQRGGAIVSYSDPHVPTVEQGEVVHEEVSCEIALERGFDCGVITTNHPEFDYEAVASRAARVVDTRNALKEFSGDHIYRF